MYNNFKSTRNMKKYLFLLLAAATFAACDDDTTREPSPVTPADCQDVYFPASNFAQATVSPTDKEISLTVKRSDDFKETAVEVPVKVSTIAPECFLLPETISFAAGETETEYVIGLTDEMEPFKEYSFTLEIAPEYADYYTEKTDGSARWNASITKSDFQPYAKCVFASALFRNPFYQQIDYSALLDQYRLPDIWDDGLHFDFKWDGGDTFHPIGTDNNGIVQVYIGPYDEESDMYLLCAPDCPYDAENEMFILNPEWYVTHYGNQGVRQTYFYIVEKY